jgi:cell division septation protein DedD
MSLRRPLALFAATLLLAACSGPQTGADDGGAARNAPTPEERRRAAVAQYETFDVATYPVRPPDQTVEVEHQVPRRLMQGRADEGATQTLEGYRIQVFSADDQGAAQEFRERVRKWWTEAQEEAPDALFRETPPIVIEYSQPYYRVRFGAFADRDAAEKALDFVRKEYDGAFVAQSTVTVVQ